MPLPTVRRIEGVDVDHDDGEIDWEKVAEPFPDGNRIGIAYVKATQGASFIDPRFSDNWRRLRLVPTLLRGAYMYFVPGVDPESQASNFADVLGALFPEDLSPCIDFETLANKGEQFAPIDVLMDVIKCVGRLQHLYPNRKIVLYGGAWFLSTVIARRLLVGLNNTLLWDARYGPTPPDPLPQWDPRPAHPHGWSGWQWQGTQPAGSAMPGIAVPGIAWPPDRSVWDCDIADLQELLTGNVASA